MVEACSLRLRGKERTHVKGEIFTGIIIDTGRSCILGARSGNLFRAHLDHQEAGDYKINFLLSNEDLEKGAEALKKIERCIKAPYVRGDLPEELFEFYDLFARSARIN